MTNADFLDNLDLFQELPTDLRRLVSELFGEEHFEDDQIVFRAGDPSRHLYVVRTGAVVLFSDRVGEVVALKARVETGSVFGEVGVLEGAGRTLSARASGPTTLLVLDGRSLLELAGAYDGLALRLSKVALRYSFENHSSRIELARRREARIRVGAQIELRIERREPVTATLENLSLGGACLAGLPENWSPDQASRVSLAIDRETALVSVRARVAWRKNDRIGIAFTETFDDHEMRVANALHRLTGLVLSVPA